ncbi:MAG: ABC transporter substrate-binding protein [Anaeroplasma sp.]
MKKRILFIILAMLSIFALGSCNKDKKEAISIYLWSNVLIDNGYAEFIQSQLPDVDIEFVVGNNDLSYYQFMKDNNSLPDIITARRFSLHDAVGLKDQLMDLSSTEEAGAIYDSYLKDFINDDNTVNWLPLCGEADGFIANKKLFEKNNIPIPTDYNSFISACQKFEEIGIRGFAADFKYDYTCMEILQGLSISELNSIEGKIWRQNYENVNSNSVGLDDVVWPKVFENMEKFIKDAKVLPEDISSSFSKNYNDFLNGKIAIIRSGGGNVVASTRTDSFEPIFLPYFCQNGEQWILTYPSFHVALNKDLGNNNKRKQDAMKILKVMLSNDGQKKLSSGQDIISYSQNADLEIDSSLGNIKNLISNNHLYIRIASNDFFSVSQTVVSKMIKGELSAQQAYQEFDNLLKNTKSQESGTILSLDKEYENRFTDNGNESYSFMANSLRNLYQTDVLLAPFNSFTGTTIKADYDEKIVGYMIMPNALDAYKATFTGEGLKEFIRKFVEGKAVGCIPFNDNCLPTVSGMQIVVKRKEIKNDSGECKYELVDVLVNDKSINNEDTFTITCLSTAAKMGQFMSLGFVKENKRVINAWVEYIKNGGTLVEPEKYIRFE